MHIDDGRAFLYRTDKEYDLILLALPDSLTLVTGQLGAAGELPVHPGGDRVGARPPRPGGVFAMYNYYREAWLIDRLRGHLAEVFGHAPCIDTLTPAKGRPIAMLGPMTPTPSTATAPATRSAPPARRRRRTDDQPFPYLNDRSIPGFYVVTIGSSCWRVAAGGPGVAGRCAQMLRYSDLFFMGAAFLLLETKSVVQFALLFGTTWFVNALVFLGVLVSVLAAVLLTQRATFRHPGRLYLVLLAGLALAWRCRPSALLTLDFVPRFVVAVLLAFLPIFVANLIFAQRFKSTSVGPPPAFGANLLGAMFGGLLEYASLIIGYRMLLPVVAVLHTLPLDGAGGLGRDVVGHPVDARHLVDDAARHRLQDVVGQPGPVGGHGVLAGHRPDDDRVGVGALVAHDPHRADVGQHRERLPDLPLQAGLAQLLPHDGVGVLQHRHLLRRDLADDPHGQARPGNGWRHTISSGRPSSSPTRRTSSLNRARSGSTSSKVMSSGRPPTLWWVLMVDAPVPPPDSITSG